MLSTLALALGLLAGAPAPTALGAPSPKGLAVNPARAVVVAGPIMQGNILPLGDHLLELSAKAPRTPVDIILDSPGGDVITGLLFVNQLEAVKARGTKVRCFVPTLAASMAFQILLHCDERYTLDFGLLLWHGVRIYGYDGALTTPVAFEVARQLNQLDQLIITDLRRFTGLDDDTLSFHFVRETLHFGTDLAVLAPQFIRSYAAIPGLLQALASAPRSEPPMREDGPEEFKRGEPIHLAPERVLRKLGTQQ